MLCVRNEIYPVTVNSRDFKQQVKAGLFVHLFLNSGFSKTRCQPKQKVRDWGADRTQNSDLES